MFFHPCRDVRQAAWDSCSYRWIIWSKWEIELCVISVEMVGEAMCLCDGTTHTHKITFTISFFSKEVVVLEVCLRSLSCWNTALRPSLWKGRDHALLQLCHSTCWHSWFPSMNCSFPVPAALMQLQTMTLPPPCLTVGKTYLSLYSSPGCRHTRLTPSEPNTFIFVSSDHRTWFQ